MRVLVLSGTGFVGSVAVTRLCEMGHEVIVAHRGRTEADHPPDVRHVHHPSVDSNLGAEFLDGLFDELRRLEPEVVVHMQPIGDADAGAVVRAFGGVARRVVAISSIDVYRAYGRLHRTEPGPPDPVPLFEDSPLRAAPSWEPGKVEKILAERVLMAERELPATILRWSMVYGKRDPFPRLYAYLRQMDDGRPAILLEAGKAQWRWSRAFNENVAHAVVLAVTDERAAGRVYNVAEPEALNEAEWVAAIGRAAGWQGAVVAVPREVAPPHLVPGFDTNQQWVVDTSRIRAELGYDEPVGREEALGRTVAWLRANPPQATSRWAIASEELRRCYAEEDALLGWAGLRRGRQPTAHIVGAELCGTCCAA